MAGETTLTKGEGGQDVVAVETQECTGEVYLHGATVTSWQPAGQEPVIWLSSEAIFDGQTAIRGGVPICFPWFGPGRDGDRTPAHGWARTSEWTFEGAQLSTQAAVLTFSLQRDGADCRYVVTMGQTLELSLTTTAIGGPVDVEQALHTYFAVGDIAKVALQGLDGVEYVDKVGTQAVRRQDGAVTFSGETDRVYLSNNIVTLDDAALGRRLQIEATGTQDTVVWNPWADRAAQMKDFSNDAWTGMVCVESGNVLNNSYVLAQGESRTITQRITVL